MRANFHQNRTNKKFFLPVWSPRGPNQRTNMLNYRLCLPQIIDAALKHGIIDCTATLRADTRVDTQSRPTFQGYLSELYYANI